MDGKFDVVIIGGGIMGVSTAYWLSEMDPALSIAVFERDPTHEFSSTALSVASIRQQFSSAINVRISQFGIEFVRGFADRTANVGAFDLGFRGNGYLFLAGSPDGAETLSENCRIQTAEGAATRLYTASELSNKYTWMNTEDISIASLGGDYEGWFDNMGLLSGMRGLAKKAGVQFIHGDVVGLDAGHGNVHAVTTEAGVRFQAGHVVNAAGPRATKVCAMLGEILPVEPRKRTVFVVDAPKARHPDAPLIVDHQGIYARPEGDLWITATVPEKDPEVDPEDFEPHHELFEQVIWEKLYHRIDGFDAARVLRFWAGHYAFNTFDQNAIVGRHPNWSNFYLVNGFSGHGLQQAPAMGRGLAELIVHGSYRSLDLTALAFERIAADNPVIENEIV